MSISGDSPTRAPPGRPARGRPTLGVRGKLIALVLVLLIPVLALDLAETYARYSLRLDQEYAESRLFADSVSTAFGNYVESLWDTELGLGNALALHVDMTPDDAEALLRAELVQLSAVRVLYWIGPDGTVIAATRDGRRGMSLTERDYFRRVAAGEDMVVSDVMFGIISEAPTVFVARGIRRDGNLMGVMMAGLDIDRMDQVLPTVTGEKRCFGFVDRNGLIVYRTGSGPMTMEERKLPPDDPVRHSLAGEVQPLRNYAQDSDGRDQIGVAVPVHPLGWAFFSGVSERVVMARAGAEAARELGVLALAALLSLVAALYIAQDILRPISLLRRAARSISAGDLSARVALAGRDEVAAAAQTFDSMAARIQLADEVQKARVTAVAHLIQQALVGANARELAEEATGLVVLSLGLEGAAVLEVVPGTVDLRVQAGVGLSDDLGGRLAGSPEALVARRVLTGGEPALVADLGAEPGGPAAHAPVSGAGIAMTAGERVYGVLTVTSVRTLTLAPADLHFLQAVASVLAAAIQQKRLEADRAFLSRAGSILSSSLDYETTLGSLAELATEHLADWCIIDLLQGDGGIIRRVCAANPTPEKLAIAREHDLVAAQGLTHWRMVREALDTGEPVLLAEVTASMEEELARNSRHLAAVRSMGARSGIIVPLVARGRRLGIIWLVSSESGRRYGPEDVGLAMELAQRAALAVDHASMYRQATAALEQRDRALAEAEVERERLHNLFEEVPALICIMRGPEHEVTMFNRIHAAVIGEGRLTVGRPIMDCLPELRGQGFGALLDGVYESGVPFEGTEVRAALDRLGNGALEERFFNFVYQPMRDAQGQLEGILSFAVDVTEQVRARRHVEALAADLRLLAKQQAAVARLGQRLIGGATVPDVTAEAVDLVRQVLSTDACRIMELMPDGTHLRIVAGTDWSPGGVVPLTCESGLPSQAGYTLQAQEPVLTDDFRRESRFEVMRVALETGITSGASIVIPGEDGAYGILSVHTRAHRSFTQDDVNFLVAVAHLVSQAVQHERDERRLLMQLAVARILGAAPAATDAFPQLLEAVGDGLGWDVALLWVVDRVSGLLHCMETWQRTGVAAGPFLGASIQTPQGQGRGLVGQVWEKAEPIWIADAAAEEAFLRRQAAAEVGLHGGLWIPVLLADSIFGVIECFSRQIRRPEPAVMRMASAVGSQIGQFLQRTHTEAELRRLNAELEERVAARTEQLAAANRELEAFAYSVSHDLRAPLRTIDGFSQALLEDCAEAVGPDGEDYLRRIRGATRQMATLIDDLLRLSRVMRSELHRERVDLTALAESVAEELQRAAPERRVAFVADPGLIATGDERLLRVVLQNLLMNAWKFTGKRSDPEVHFGAIRSHRETVYFVRDNGAGFDMQMVHKLFVPFQRLHTTAEFEGTGIGLVTVQRIVHRHGGRIWAESRVGAGATFYFTL